MLRLILAHKVIAVLVAVVVVVVAGGAGAGFGLANSNNTPNCPNPTSCLSSTGLPQAPASPYVERVDTLKMCENNNLGFSFLWPYVELNGSYCMVMVIPVTYNGTEAWIGTLPGAEYSSLPSGNIHIRHVQQVGSGQVVTEVPSTKPPNVVPTPWTGGLCYTTPNGSANNQQTVVQCGISDQPYQNGWDQISGPGLSVFGGGTGTFSGQSMPVLTLAPGSGCTLITIPLLGSCPPIYWQYIMAEAPVTASRFQPTIAANPYLYLMMNIKDTEAAFPDLPAADSKDNYPWVRAQIDTNGMLSCTVQGDPSVASGDDTPGSGDFSGTGNCPKDSVTNGTPVTVNAHPPTESPAPLPTGPGVPGIGPSPTTSGGGGVGIPVPPPPADALAAWQTVPQDDAQELPTTFKAISGDLLATGQVPDPFTKQEGELDQLATIPFGGGLSEDTPAQQAEAKADLADLDNFFSTPGLTPSGG